MAHGRVVGLAYGAGIIEPWFHGYETHLGETLYEDGVQLFAESQRCGDPPPMPDGTLGRNSVGKYLPGLFRDDRFRHALLAAARSACGLEPAHELAKVEADPEHRLDRLAEHVRTSLDMSLIHEWLGVSRP
jgi:adenosylcobyric acid synthase